MADDLTLFVGFYLLSAALLGAYVVLTVRKDWRSGEAAASAGTGVSGPAVAPPEHLDLIDRRVRDEHGNDVGESVKIDGETVIVEKEDKIWAVPVGALRLSGDDLVPAAPIDWVAAAARGEEWRARQPHKEMRFDDDDAPVHEEEL